MEIERKLKKIAVEINGDRCFDPFRKKYVQVIPEEIVRQKVAVYFRDKLKVPENLIYTEEALSHWGGCDNPGRADIVVGYKENEVITAVAVIECKSTDIPLTAQVYEQVEGYADELGASYIFITNGIEIQGWYQDDNGDYVELAELPTYSQMLDKDVKLIDNNEYHYERCSKKDFAKYDKFYDKMCENGYIGDDLPACLVKHVVNFADCLYDTTHKVNPKKYRNFELLDDIGVVYLRYGDASGSDFGTGNYRSFTIKDLYGNNHVICLGMQTTGKFKNDPWYGTSDGKSVLVVSIRDVDADYTVAQINLNKCLTVEDDKLVLIHDGKGGGAGFAKAELIKKVADENPNLVCDNAIYLGTLPADKMLYMDMPEMQKLIGNIIEYTLIRNDYKLKVSEQNKSNRRSKVGM